MRRECESAISGVVVYARGAIVTRRVQVPAVDDGDVDVVVPGVTALAEPGSARARVVGEGRRVLSVHSAPWVPGDIVRAAPSDALMLELGARIDRVKSELALLERRRKRLVNLTLEPGLAPRAHGHKIEARTRDVLVAHDLTGDALRAIDERIVTLEPTLHRLQAELRAAELAREWASAQDRAPSGQASRVITVRVSGRGPIESLEIDYAVTAARWWPMYTLDIGERGTSATFWLEAQVAQASGEDWTGVALALSTSDLVTDARLPELRSVRYGKAQPLRRAGYRPPPDGLDRLFAGWDVAFASLVVKQEIQIRQEVRVQVAKPRPAPQAPSVARSQLLGAEEAAYDEDSEAEMAEPTPVDYAEEVAPSKKRAKLDMRARDEPLALGAPASFSANAPTMARMSAPMPVASRGGFFGGGPGGGGAPSAPQGSLDEGAGAAIEELVMGGDAGGAQEPEAAWLDFDRLRLARPEDRAHRGRLRASGYDDDAVELRGHARAEIMVLRPTAPVFDVLDTRGHYDHRWDASAHAHVPSDARAHRLRIESFAARPRFRFWAVPLEVAEVFREASLDNPTPGPLLRGPVDVYVDGSLLTTAPLPHVDRGGVLRVGLGVEERLRIARNVRVAEDSAGLLGGSTAVDHHVSIELKSSLGNATTVEVYDRVPVSDDKGLDVKVVSESPASDPYKQTERGIPIKGGLGWRVQLEPGGKREVKLHYRLTMSNKSEVVGGNRRD